MVLDFKVYLDALRSDTRSISFNINLYHIYYNFEQVATIIVTCFSFIKDSNYRK